MEMEGETSVKKTTRRRTTWAGLMTNKKKTTETSLEILEGETSVKKTTRRRITWLMTNKKKTTETSLEILEAQIFILIRQYRFVSLTEIQDRIPEEFLKGNTELPENADNHPRPAWGVVTWSNSEFRASSLEEFKDDYGVDLLKMLSYPRGLGRVTGNTTTALCNSLLLLSIGGLYPVMRCDPIKEVQCFNFSSNSWTKFSSLNTGRCYHAVVTVRDSIYVFGTANCGPDIISPEHWGERYDIAIDKWSYLPEPPELLYNHYLPLAHAVYHNCQPFVYRSQTNEKIRVSPYQNLILFLLPEPGSPISVFNCTTDTWLPDMYPFFPKYEVPPIFPYWREARLFQDRLVVIHGVLIWRHLGHIHGYDIIHRQYLKNLYKIPLNQLHQILSFDDPQPDDPPMFLFQSGEGKLIILFQSNRNKYVVHCHKFRIQTGASFCLIHECYSRLSTEFKSTKQESLLDVLLL